MPTGVNKDGEIVGPPDYDPQPTPRVVEPGTTPNPPKTPRGPLRMNLPLTKQATDQIKAKARHYPGQHGDFVIRLARRYEAEHLATDLAAIVEEKERERRQELGLEHAPAEDVASKPEGQPFIGVDLAEPDSEMVVRGYLKDGKIVGFEREGLPPIAPLPKG